jgi:CRISPR-associated protein Cas5d
LLDDFSTEPAPIIDTRDLGFMLYDLDFQKSRQEPAPAFFRAYMNNGIINVPAWESEEVRK